MVTTPGNARGSLRVFSADCDPNESGSDEKRSGSEETPKLQKLNFQNKDMYLDIDRLIHVQKAQK